MNNYLLEVGVEEFPSRFVAATKQQFADLFAKGLKEAELSAAQIRVESTPRRFAIWLRDIQPLSQTDEEIVKGPARRIAYDENGRPSKALQGFLRSKGIEERALFFEMRGKEEYVFARVTKTQTPIAESLAELVPQVIRGISNPRSMRWGGKNLRFLRPIRWMLSLLNDEVLPFDLEGLPVSNHTRGHRFLGASDILVEKQERYEALLEENSVIVDEKKRRDIIVRGLNRLAREKGGTPLMDEALLDEVVSIVEIPTVFIGNVPKRYMTLPKEVIITPMKDHQRYFPILNDRGELLPYFLSVRNGNEYGIENVQTGNEKVLTPRLEDARFFFDQDCALPLEEYNGRLNELTFHEALGSMAAKTVRLERLTGTIGQQLLVGEETIHHASRAAILSKADLVTHMVVEFTELEGTMGRIYATLSEENDIVAKAIEEQYMPRSAGSDRPQSTAGILLSIADKVDTIAGLSAIGIQVSGSQDPFGLRRAALGIIDILTENGLYLDLQKTFRDALVFYVEQQGLVFDYDEVMERIRVFFLNRLRTRLRERGVRYDLIDAVLATEGFDIVAFDAKCEALSKSLSRDGGEDMVTSFVRIGSMAEKASGTTVRPELLQESEREMAALLEKRADFQSVLDQRHYGDALEMLGEWMEVVNRYMDANMILVEDEAVRENRLSLLNAVYHCIHKLLVPQHIVRA